MGLCLLILGKLRIILLNYYDSLYTEQSSWRPRVDGISFSSIDADECLWLERGFEEQEVWEVVREMNGDKAPGPDGFSMAFFQKCWGILKKDIMAVFQNFIIVASLRGV